MKKNTQILNTNIIKDINMIKTLFLYVSIFSNSYICSSDKFNIEGLLIKSKRPKENRKKKKKIEERSKFYGECYIKEKSFKDSLEFFYGKKQNEKLDKRFFNNEYNHQKNINNDKESYVSI